MKVGPIVSQLPLTCLCSPHDLAFYRPALIIAHPGHELRALGWLSHFHPVTYILTNGSGLAGTPRLEPTLELLAEFAAPQGDIFGALSDREVYAALLRGDAELFLAILEQLASSLSERQVDFVLGDSA